MSREIIVNFYKDIKESQYCLKFIKDPELRKRVEENIKYFRKRLNHYLNKKV